MNVKVNWKELASYGVTDPHGKGQMTLEFVKKEYE